MRGSRKEGGPVEDITDHEIKRQLKRQGAAIRSKALILAAVLTVLLLIA
jgi:CHASE3 domain sensor protein